MTRELVLPTLDSSATVALLVAADPSSAPTLAWAVARAAGAERRTALIDLTLGEGALDAGAHDAGSVGIVDVFEFGASWSHVARPQDLPGLYFVPDGTPASDPHEIWGNARWEKLRRGFQQQGALLLLYVPAKALADLAPRADLVVVLGEGPSLATARAYAAGRDLPLVGPVTMPVTPAAPEPAPEERATAAGASPSEPPRRWVPWTVGIVAALVVFGTAFLVLRPGDPADATPATPPAPATTPAPAAASGEEAPTQRPPDPAPASPAAVQTVDTLFYAVQVAAFNRLAPASALAASLERAGHVVAVTPVYIGPRRVLWYRILLGALETPGAAARTRSALWTAGLLQRGEGTVLRVPHTWAFDLTGVADPAAVRSGLRQGGIPAYIVSGPGAPRLYFGAFESPEQAAAAEALLAGTDRAHTLVARSGTTR